MPRLAPPNSIGLTQHAFWSDLDNQSPLLDQLERARIPHQVKSIPHLAGMNGCAYLLGYKSPRTEMPVTVLCVPNRPDIDSFCEEYYYWENLPFQDALALGEDAWLEWFDQARAITSNYPQ